MATRGGLLRTGVTGYPAFHSFRRFEIGGIGIVMSTRPFDIEQPALVVQLIRPFDIEGRTVAMSTRPFDFLGALRVLNARPFDIVEHITTPVPGTVVGHAPSAIATTLSAPASAGATSVTVTSGAGITVGSVVRVGGEIRIVTGIS